jgi:hypothetical protein
MAHFRTRGRSIAAGAAALGIVLASVSSTPSKADPPARAAGLSKPFTVATGRAGDARGNAVRRGHYAVTPTSCPEDLSGSGNGGSYFVGVDGSTGGNYADNNSAAVLGGNANEVCDYGTAIGAGSFNDIGNDAGADYSFVGSGRFNAITGQSSLVGSGLENEVTGSEGFIGVGSYGVAEAAGSFVGSGGSVYAADTSNPVAGGSNIAGATDSFVGAGDVNQIASGGTGSFIGAGGTVAAKSGTTSSNNSILGSDSFVGAGDGAAVAGEQGFVGSGMAATLSANYAGIVAGDADTVSGISSIAGAGANLEVSSQDAFGGAGASNNISAEGAFVGAGGTIGPANTAGGQDAFAGAGDDAQPTGPLSVVVAGYGISATAAEAFAGAGFGNQAEADYAAIACGLQNSAGGGAFVGGGDRNSAYGGNAFVGAGSQNTVKGDVAAMLGGYGNSAKGAYATVAGGYGNTAAGELSFVAGYHAEATHPGSFVWSDYHAGSALLKDSAANQFLVRAYDGTYFYSNEAATSGVVLTLGSGTWANLSDRNAKTDIVPLDDASILAKVGALPVESWQYTSEKGVRHIGPMAQDFYAAFGTGVDERHIASIDEGGVALAAIKALHAAGQRKDAMLQARQREIDALQSTLRRLNVEFASSRNLQRS